MKIKQYANEDLAKEIRAAIKQSNGHCPCVLEQCRNQDTLCICKEFRTAPENTICHCGLYIKVEN